MGEQPFDESILDITRDEISRQLHSLEEAQVKLEEAYAKKDYESFEKIKKFMKEIQKKIQEKTDGK